MSPGGGQPCYCCRGLESGAVAGAGARSWVSTTPSPPGPVSTPGWSPARRLLAVVSPNVCDLVFPARAWVRNLSERLRTERAGSYSCPWVPPSPCQMLGPLTVQPPPKDALCSWRRSASCLPGGGLPLFVQLGFQGPGASPVQGACPGCWPAPCTFPLGGSRGKERRYNQVTSAMAEVKKGDVEMGKCRGSCPWQFFLFTNKR